MFVPTDFSPLSPLIPYPSPQRPLPQTRTCLPLGGAGITLTVIGAGVTSLAGVYSEWVMKRRVMHSFALQNLQLYGFGILFSGGALWIEQGDQIMQVWARSCP